MIKPWRLLVAAALNVTVGVGAVAAQSVLVRQVPPGETIELVLNATKVATATADASGEATLPLDLQKNIGKTEIDANIFLDVCDKLYRVIVVERTKLPDPQQPGCARRDIPGLYWVRQVNTLVVDVGGPTPKLLLIKGPYTVEVPHTWTQAPAGLVVFGGGGFLTFRDAAAIFCGSVTSCSGKDRQLAYTGGATFWITPFLGAEASYLRPRKVTAQGSGDTFRFDSSLDTQIVTVAGKVGVPIGPVRLYGQAGMNYHQATSLTTETIDTVAQTLQLKTKGWGWLFGGGGEVWLAGSFALYGELGFAAIKGPNEAGGEGRIDDRVHYIVGGARVRIGRSR